MVARHRRSAPGCGPDARRAAKDTLIAESRLWAGEDGSWRDASRARPYADTPVVVAEALLGGLKVSGSSVTLSGTSGRVPVNVHNPSDRILNVVVTASAPRAVSYTHLRAHETRHDLVCRLLLE